MLFNVKVRDSDGNLQEYRPLPTIKSGDGKYEEMEKSGGIRIPLGEDVSLQFGIDVGITTGWKGLVYELAAAVDPNLQKNCWLVDNANNIIFRVGGGSGIDYDSSRTPYPLHIGADTKFEGVLTGVEIIGDVNWSGGRLSNDGIRIHSSETFAPENSLRIVTSDDAIVGSIWGNDNRLRLSAGEAMLFKADYGDITLDSINTWSKVEVPGPGGFEVGWGPGVFDNEDASTSATSGALRVAGGIGVAKDSFFGAGIRAANLPTDTTELSPGDLFVEEDFMASGRNVICVVP